MALTLTLHQLKDVTNFVLKLIQLRSFLLCQKNGFSLLTRHLQKKLKLYVLFAICTPFMISVCLSVCLSMIVICFWSLQDKAYPSKHINIWSYFDPTNIQVGLRNLFSVLKDLHLPCLILLSSCFLSQIVCFIDKTKLDHQNPLS